jgi:hypothetical protein
MNPPANQTKIRVLSDAFPVPGGWGRYGCGYCNTAGGYKAGVPDREAGKYGGKGLILLRGSKAEIERTAAGTVVEVGQNVQAEFDGKTGALIVNLTDRR